MKFSNDPDVVVICGSTRFIEEMKELERDLMWKGNVVFAPTKFDLKTPDSRWANPVDRDAGAARLAKAHYAAIRLSDWVLVYGDYVGESVTNEISYAHRLDIPVFFTDQKLAVKFGGSLLKI